MNIKYIETKKDINKKIKLCFKLKVPGYDCGNFLRIAATIVFKIKCIFDKSFITEKEVQLLEDKIVVKSKDLGEFVVNYKEVVEINEIEDVIIISNTLNRPICISYKAFKNTEERIEFLKILKEKCDFKIKERLERYDSGIISEDKKVEELTEEEKRELAFKGSNNKNNYIRLTRIGTYTNLEWKYKRFLNINAFCISGIFLALGVYLTKEYGMSRIILMGFLGVSIALVYLVNKYVYKEKNFITKKLKEELDDEITTEFLIGNSQIMYKINEQEKIYSFDKIKGFEKRRLFTIIRVEEEDGTILPITLSTISNIQGKAKKLRNTIEEKTKNLEGVLIEKEKIKVCKRKLIGSMISFFILGEILGVFIIYKIL
ncbi:hypothetical protein [Clostridium sp.]|uniref:hypothetical protein n=1 Tax=Clostridium sp. TaxID=1506 RepID=UPI0039917442